MKPQQQVFSQRHCANSSGVMILIDKSVRFYLSAAHSLIECVFAFSG